MSDFLWGFSKASCFFDCPRKFQHKYILGTKTDTPQDATLAFGSALHSALNAILTGEDGGEIFRLYWESYRDKPLEWGRYTWAQYAELGYGFLRKFLKYYAPRFKVVASEKTLRAAYKGVQFEGTVDLLAEFDGVLTLVDFKTAGAPYDKAKAGISFQLYLYAYLCEHFGHRPDQLMYLPFVKGTGSIQTPVIAQFDPKAMLAALDDFINLLPQKLPTDGQYPRNMNSCFGYEKRCEFIGKCFPVQMVSDKLKGSDA